MRGAKLPKIQELKQMLRDQKYKCALSGRDLTPEDATIDHKVPVTDGGTSELDNLHWVCSEVNKAKGTMSMEQFRRVCRDVHNHSRQLGSSNNKPI